MAWKSLFALDPGAWLVCRLCGGTVGADHDAHAEEHRSEPGVEIRRSERAFGGYEWRDLLGARPPRDRRPVPPPSRPDGPPLVRTDPRDPTRGGSVH